MEVKAILEEYHYQTLATKDIDDITVKICQQILNSLLTKMSVIGDEKISEVELDCNEGNYLCQRAIYLSKECLCCMTEHATQAQLASDRKVVEEELI